ncbi:MAG: hypothetical protein GEU83_10110 [Pseudonocardiaceae bacterium]|nr:hypothetical protein [Pseudonocardiaceae bacterium]
MADKELAEEDPTPADESASTAEPTPPEDPREEEEEEERKLFGVIPLSIAALVGVVVLPILGYLFGMIGTGQERTTVPVELVVSPERAGGALEPGVTGQFAVLVENPNDYGVQVSSISAGASKATPGGCPAGAVTSEAVDGPPGYIGPTSVHSYQVNAKIAAEAGDGCEDESFTLPLEAELVSAG